MLKYLHLLSLAEIVVICMHFACRGKKVVVLHSNSWHFITQTSCKFTENVIGGIFMIMCKAIEALMFEMCEPYHAWNFPFCRKNMYHEFQRECSF